MPGAGNCAPPRCVRCYDPRLGHFRSRDTFLGVTTDPASQHPYSYYRNNPTILSDPPGEIANVPSLVAAYAAFEVASTVIDAAITVEIIADPYASLREALLTAGLFFAGTVPRGYATVL